MACSHRLTAGSDLHPDPSLFDPGRWQAIRPDRTTYIPFGAGAGKCIGDRFSLTQAVLALATITARWRLAPVRSRPVRPAALNATVSPGRLRMRLTDRS